MQPQHRPLAEGFASGGSSPDARDFQIASGGETHFLSLTSFLVFAVMLQGDQRHQKQQSERASLYAGLTSFQAV